MADVTLTIDGRDVTVPAGTGLVEAAAAVDVEIPVFCYEPRIGPAVGACRMCLVEVEGAPKLQAACATAVRPGMVVSTVGDRAREGQEAVLEFLLLNHPLDCPVCDKGGECPLQDHAFRWGPGSSRFTEPKRVNDKPIPISPTIALDRERCILCYRCTRFSAEVSEDLQLIARQRGASSVIATFEGRPWEGHHTGNVIELCPVGALTSTQYRFAARPWETTDHPSIAPWDPVGTNVSNTVREGRVVRVLSRRNDAVDVGWIDDRTRFAYESMYGPARILRPTRGGVETSMEVLLEWLHDQLLVGAGSDLWVLSGAETIELGWAVRQVAAQTGGRVVAAPGMSAAVPQASATIADLSTAQRIWVLGHADLLDVAPALDLRIRHARAHGAAVTVAGVGGTRLADDSSTHDIVGPDGLDAYVRQLCDAAANDPQSREAAAMFVYRDGELSPESIELLTSTFDLHRPSCGLLAISGAANSRGLAAIGIEEITVDELLSHTGGIAFVGVDPARLADDAAWRGQLAAAAWSVAIDTLPAPHHDVVDAVVPGAWLGEQDGTLVNLEGRLQRATVGIEPPDGVRPPLRWIAGLARRLGSTVPGNAASAYRHLHASHSDTLPAAGHGDIAPGGVLGVRGGAAPRHAMQPAPAVGDDALALYVAPHLYDSPEVAYTPALSFLRDQATLVLHRSDARARGLARGDRAHMTYAQHTVDVVVHTSTRIAPGHARIYAGTGTIAPGHVGWHAATITPVESAPATLGTAVGDTVGER